MIYNFYHITDTHYFSKKNFKCDPFAIPQPKTQICIVVSEEAFKKALDIVIDDKDTDTVIITGDLTNHGDKASHDEVRELLQNFSDRGGKPFVVTDSHDYPPFDTYTVDENGKNVPAEHMKEEEVVPLYYPFGKDKAFDTFNEGTTYIAEILPDLYYIAMGYSFSGKEKNYAPEFSDELMNWVKKHVDDIKEKGGTVICGTHRPIVTPSPAYEILGKGNTFYNGEKRAKELADMGVRLFFSGHTHIQCTKEITSDKGNKIYSIQTSSLSGFPPKMRKITIDTDKGTADVKTIDMELPELDLGMSFSDYARNGFLGIIEKIPYNMEHDVEAFANTEGGISLPKDLILKHPKIIMYFGRKLNALSYGKVARFSKKYHGMKKEEYASSSEKKFVDLLLEIIANLYRGNAAYSPETVEYKITMGSMKKIEKLAHVLHIDIRKLLGGYSLTEFIEPLLYNSGVDDDNAVLDIK